MATNDGIFNEFTVLPKNLNQYSAFRGVVDYSQLSQFDQFETGYSFLKVLGMPKFMEHNNVSNTIKDITRSFKHMLEYEFRGLTGLPDTTSDTFTITDGATEARLINNVTRDTAISVSMTYYERRGGLITKFSDYYLTGIKDPYSKAKTYHGLIKNGDLAPGLENEIFTLLYMVTDNTYLSLERAVLLANCQLTKAETSMYDSEKGQISNREVTLEFNCLPITGYMVDKAADKLLRDITGVMVDRDPTAGTVSYSLVKDDIVEGENGIAALDSASYKYGIMREKGAVGEDGKEYMNTDKNDELIDAFKSNNKQQK